MRKLSFAAARGGQLILSIFCILWIKMPGSISERLFNKPLYELTESDLQLYFDEEQMENSNLEFKSSSESGNEDAVIFKISQTLSAFLNSDGGVIIWGAPKETSGQDPKRKNLKGPLTPVKKLYEKVSLIRKVTSIITPLTPKIKLHIIYLAGGGYCYIFEVEKSEYSPHQIYGRYLIRLDGSNAGAPDYIVQALMKRVSYPKIFGKIIFLETITGYDYFMIPFIVCIANHSHFLPEKNLDFDLYATQGQIVKPNEHQIDFVGLERKSATATREIIHFGAPITENYILLFKRRDDIYISIKVKHLLSFSGDTSPVKDNHYDLVIQANRHPPYYSYSLTPEYENKSVVDQDENSGEIFQNAIKSFQESVHDLSVHRFISQRIP